MSDFAQAAIVYIIVFLYQTVCVLACTRAYLHMCARSTPVCVLRVHVFVGAVVCCVHKRMYVCV